MYTFNSRLVSRKMIQGILSICLILFFSITTTIATQAEGLSTVYFEDFETSNAGYTTAGTNVDWAWGTPTTWPSSCASGNFCWGTNLSGNYQHNSNQELLSPVIDLSNVALPHRHRLKVSWRQALYIQSSTTSTLDTASVEVNLNGGGWQTLWSYYGGTSQQNWGATIPLPWDITEAVGGTVQLRWRLTSNASTAYAGFYVDDVHIYHEEAPPTLIDVSISLYNSPLSDNDRTPYERIIEYFADGVYEASNGTHKIRKVTIYPNEGFANRADVIWIEQCHPNAHVSGAIIPGWRVEMCDRFSGFDFLEDDFGWKMGGYTLAHEWGHYHYSLRDEYRGDGSRDHLIGSPHSTDDPVEPSIMNTQYRAICTWRLDLFQPCWPWQQGRFEWLNFSVDSPDNRNTAQYRVYGATGWETLVRPLSQDPRDGQRAALPQRIYHPELVNAAPTDGNPIIMLPSDAARNDLDIIWATRDTTFQIVIDSSGSMSGTSLANVKTAARLLVDLAEIDHATIGVIKFSSTATVVMPLTLVDSEDVKNNIKAAIDTISATGQTAIGTAAQLALDGLVSYGAEDTNRIVYLLTDGENNSGIPPLSVIPGYQAASIPLFTFGYGSSVNHAELQQMASETGGFYYFSPTTLEDLQQVFQDAAQLGSSTVGIIAGTATVTSSVPSTLPIYVDSTLNRMNVSVSYPGTVSAVNLVLRDPTGNPTDPASCSLSGNEVLCLFTVESPDSGGWSLEAIASSSNVNVNYRASGSAVDQMTYYTSLTSLTGAVVEYPDPIVLMAVLGKEWPISQALVTGTIQKPDGSIATIQLTDDGSGPDAVANDGNYSAILDYSQNGVHNITVQFNNSAGTAQMTPMGLAPSIGPDGEAIPMPDPIPVNENFERFVRLQVTVTGLQADDHGNTPAQATLVVPDNSNVPGRIDYSGDVDVFRFEALHSGELVIRVANLALGMDPRLILFAADGSNLLADIDLTTNAAARGYLYLPVDVAQGDIIFAEVSNLSGEGQGFYEISVGSRIVSDEDPPLQVFLPLIAR